MLYPITLHSNGYDLISYRKYNTLTCLFKNNELSVSEASEKQLTIERSVSFNHYSNYVAAKAHDGDYNTHYSVKDGAVAGNFLKLYLSRAYSIGEVKMISRHGNVFAERMKNTEVRVYSTKNIETEVSSCGKVTGNELHRFVCKMSLTFQYLFIDNLIIEHN